MAVSANASRWLPLCLLAGKMASRIAGEVLEQQIDSWLAKVQDQTAAPRAIIAPHAGYRYCGHVMAHAYCHLDRQAIKRVFLLGPSHHAYTRKCCLSTATAYDTPLGSLRVDQEVYAELQATGKFDTMTLDVDEAEHSLELHTPYIARTLGVEGITLVPIMVGALNTAGEAAYGALLGRYLDDPANLFIISSDFCHWGQRFSYTWYDQSQGPIWQSIKWLDEQGMDTISQGDHAAFAAYLAKYRNTICGRHPIGVLLAMLEHCSTRFRLKFTAYDQSSKAVTQADSSVSYAAAVMVPAPTNGQEA